METMLPIGEILKPQGIRGEVKVLPYTDAAEDLQYYKTVYLDGEERRVLSFRMGDGAVFLGLYGVADRNAAELLRGKKLYVPRENLKPLDEGQYYIADLLGCAVVTDTGKALGTLAAVTQAATDVYTIRTAEKEILFPVADGVVLSVDVAEKKIIVSERRFFEVALL